MKKKNLAFTLAEVLIVIGIIGVVAALTLPNLNHATGDKEKVTKVKKIYSALTEAVERAQVIYGNAYDWESNGQNWDEMCAKRILEFMKVSKDCGFDSGCFASAPMPYPEGATWTECENLQEWLESRGAYSVILSDNMSLAFFDQGCYEIIRVDIDGPNQGKNMWGSDIFEFTIGYDCGDGSGTCKNNELYAGPSKNAGDVISYAAQWVIQNGNLDYLKCPDQLNWETKTSCE